MPPEKSAGEKPTIGRPATTAELHEVNRILTARVDFLEETIVAIFTAIDAEGTSNHFVNELRKSAERLIQKFPTLVAAEAKAVAEEQSERERQLRLDAEQDAERIRRAREQEARDADLRFRRLETEREEAAKKLLATG